MARFDTTSWDRLAPFYDLQLWLERHALSHAVDLAAVAAGERLLDLGTGTGGLLRVLSRRPLAPGAVAGVDVSSGMLSRVPPLPAGWELTQADARSLPFARGSFHVVTAAYLLHLLHPPALAGALSEIRRVLVTGGRLVTVTPAEPRSGLGFPWAVAAAALRRLAPSACAGLRTYDPRFELASAGFEVERARYVWRGYPSLCVRARRR